MCHEVIQFVITSQKLIKIDFQKTLSEVHADLGFKIQILDREHQISE